MTERVELRLRTPRREVRGCQLRARGRQDGRGRDRRARGRRRSAVARGGGRRCSGRRRAAAASVALEDLGHLEGEDCDEQDRAADDQPLRATVLRFADVLHSALAAHEVPPLVLGAADVEFEVVVVPVVVVDVVSVEPGIAVVEAAAWGTKALMVNVAWIWGNPFDPAANATSLTSKRRPAVKRFPFSTRTRLRSRWRKDRRL